MTQIPGPKARKIVEKTKKFCVPSTFAYPLVIKDGKGCYLEDVDGRKYLDFNTSVCSCPLGYRHPEIMKVLRDFSKQGAHKIAGQDFFTYEQAKMAEKLVNITPSNLTKVFLSNTGTEAVENAIKFAYRKKGPLVGVSCIGAFHGRTLGSLTFTYSKPVHKKNYPQLEHKRIKFCIDDKDPDLDNIETILDKTTAAFVIAEVVQGEGGYNIASKKFVKTLRKSTKDHNVPLIIDEVQSGMGRTGKWWGFENYGIKPDIIASAKALQVGATVTSEKYAPKEEGTVSSTWGGGHRLDLAVGLKIIEVTEKEKLMKNAEIVGKHILSRLIELQEKHPEKIFNARGLGLMLAVDFTSTEKRDFVEKKAFEQGLLLLGCGFKSIRITPPLTISEQEADKGLDKLEKVVKTL